MSIPAFRTIQDEPHYFRRGPLHEDQFAVRFHRCRTIRVPGSPGREPSPGSRCEAIGSLPCPALRSGRSSRRDDPKGLSLPQERSERSHNVDEVPRISRVRVALPLDRHDGERKLGQIIQREKIQIRTCLDEPCRRSRLIPRNPGHFRSRGVSCPILAVPIAFPQFFVREFLHLVRGSFGGVEFLRLRLAPAADAAVAHGNRAAVLRDLPEL